MSNLRRALPLNLAIYGLYLLVAVVMTWPLVTQMSTHFAGYPFGDAHEMTRHIWWFKHALQTGQPLIFQPLLGYPDGMQGVILWSDPLQFFPGWLFAFFLPLPAAYNLFVLLTLALNGWAAYWLIWRLTDVRTAGLLGGLAFMTAPVIQGHLAGGHGGLLVQWPLPLLAWSLLQVATYRSRAISQTQHPILSTQHFSLSTQYLVLSTFFFFLTALGHTLQLIYAVLPLVAVIGLTVIVRRDWRALLRLIIVCAAGTVLLVVFLLPVFSSTFGTSAYTAEGGGVEFSADLLGIVTPSFNHPLYGQLDYTHRVLGVNIVEGSVYVGIIAGLLALVAAWKVKAVRWWLVVGLVAWVLALGPVLKVFDQPVTVNLGGYDTYLTLPYALLYNLPGFSLARTPGRFGFLLALAVAVLVGYGWTVVSSKFQVSSDKLKASRQLSVTSHQPESPSKTQHSVLSTHYFGLGTFIIALLILLDYQSFWPLPTYSAVIPQAVYDVAGREDVRAVFDVPWDNLLTAKDALWLQTAHEKPIIAGQVTRRTPVSPAKLSILEQTLNPALLREAGADVVVVHKQYDGEGKLLASARQTLGEPNFEDAQIALFDVPETTEGVDSLQIIPAFSTITDEHTLYVYAPQAGWLNVILNHHDAPPSFRVAVDGQVLRTWAANAFAYEMPLSLPLATAGYHTITTETLLRCPERLPTAATCTQAAPTMTYEADSEWAFDTVPFDEPTRFDRGVTLAGSHLHVDTERLALDLWWQFDEERSEQDIRFVKVLDADGNQIAGDDHTLGVQAAGSEWVETVSLGLPDDLPAGEYRVFVGWYTYPDLVRFPVLTAVEGAADSMALVGTFTITSQP